MTRKLILINLIAHGFDINEAAALIGIKIRIAYTWGRSMVEKSIFRAITKEKPIFEAFLVKLFLKGYCR